MPAGFSTTSSIQPVPDSPSQANRCAGHGNRAAPGGRSSRPNRQPMTLTFSA